MEIYTMTLIPELPFDCFALRVFVCKLNSGSYDNVASPRVAFVF